MSLNWSNDAENSALITGINDVLQYIHIENSCFCFFFLKQINEFSYFLNYTDPKILNSSVYGVYIYTAEIAQGLSFFLCCSLSAQVKLQVHQVCFWSPCRCPVGLWAAGRGQQWSTANVKGIDQCVKGQVFMRSVICHILLHAWRLYANSIHHVTHTNTGVCVCVSVCFRSAVSCAGHAHASLQHRFSIQPLDQTHTEHAQQRHWVSTHTQSHFLNWDALKMINC